MATEADWTISPGKGLGQLQFGMSPAQVDALSGTYGAITGRVSDRIPDNVLRDTLEKFGDAMSEEEKRELLAMYAEHSPPSDSVTEARGEPGLVLKYIADRLVQIMPAKKQRPLFLDGQDLFALSAQEALILLEQRNGEPGRYATTAALFDKLAISVEGFCLTDPAGDVRFLTESDEDYQERTVTLREQPYVPEGETVQFTTVSVMR